MNPVSDVMLLCLCIYSHICILWKYVYILYAKDLLENTMPFQKYKIIFWEIFLETVASVIFSIIYWVKDC